MPLAFRASVIRRKASRLITNCLPGLAVNLTRITITELVYFVDALGFDRQNEVVAEFLVLEHGDADLLDDLADHGRCSVSYGNSSGNFDDDAAAHVVGDGAQVAVRHHLQHAADDA